MERVGKNITKYYILVQGEKLPSAANPMHPKYRRLEHGSLDWNKEMAWAYNEGFRDARRGLSNYKHLYEFEAAYDQGYRHGKRTMQNPTLEVPVRSQKQLGHLFDAQEHLAKAGVTFDSSSAISNRKVKAREWQLDWSLKGAKMRPNPIGTAIISGIGLGVGFNLVDWGKRKLFKNKKNPVSEDVKGLIFRKGTKRDGCRKVIQPGEQVANRWGRILCKECDDKKRAPFLAVYSIGILRPWVFKALGRRKLQCGDSLIEQR